MNNFDQLVSIDGHLASDTLLDKVSLFDVDLIEKIENDIDSKCENIMRKLF